MEIRLDIPPPLFSHHKLKYIQDGCRFVAVLLHYLFLCAFCWMLCEGVLLYLLLRVVFSEMAKTWWPFMLIGYGTNF